jgi:DNA-directed RNA polymerase specialized sigma24 family protein
VVDWLPSCLRTSRRLSRERSLACRLGLTIAPGSEQLLSNDDPITIWVDELRQGDDQAGSKLWAYFFHRLREIARSKLRLTTRAVYDEDDAAQSAFQSVCAGIIAGRFPDLHDRDSLWRLMLVITVQKVANRHRYDQRQRRDVRRNLSDSIFTNSREEVVVGGQRLASREPTPEFAAEFVEICERLLRSLEETTLKQVATLKMEGYTDNEIADRLRCSRRTVQRRIMIIRRHWEGLEVGSD